MTSNNYDVRADLQNNNGFHDNREIKRAEIEAERNSGASEECNFRYTSSLHV